METLPVSAALLVKVALEAAGSGAALWGNLKAIVERSQGRVPAGGPPDTEVLESLVRTPLRVESAFTLIDRLSEQARYDGRLLNELSGWANQALQLHAVDQYEPPAVQASPEPPEAPRARFVLDGHFAVYGGSDGGVPEYSPRSPGIFSER